MRELQNFIGTITQQTIAAGFGRGVSTLKYGLYHCSAHVFPGTELDLQVLVKLPYARPYGRQGMQLTCLGLWAF